MEDDYQVKSSKKVTCATELVCVLLLVMIVAIVVICGFAGVNAGAAIFCVLVFCGLVAFTIFINRSYPGGGSSDGDSQSWD